MRNEIFSADRDRCYVLWSPIVPVCLTAEQGVVEHEREPQSARIEDLSSHKKIRNIEPRLFFRFVCSSLTKLRAFLLRLVNVQAMYTRARGHTVRR